MTDQRIKGQEVSIKVVLAGQVVEEINAIGSMNSAVNLEKKESGFLGETVNRQDTILNSYSGDLEFEPSKASWNRFQQAVIAKATRAEPNLVFNVIETEFYPNGDTAIYSHQDVSFGAQTKSIASRGDYVKVKIDWSSSKRPVLLNQLP